MGGLSRSTGVDAMELIEARGEIVVVTEPAVRPLGPHGHHRIHDGRDDQRRARRHHRATRLRRRFSYRR